MGDSQNKPLISKVIVVAVPGLSSGLFQAKLEMLSSFTALPAPVKLLAKSAMVRPCEGTPRFHSTCSGIQTYQEPDMQSYETWLLLSATATAYVRPTCTFST